MSNRSFTLSEFQNLDRTMLANHVFARTIDWKIAIRVTSCQIPAAPETVWFTWTQYDSQWVAIWVFEDWLLKSIPTPPVQPWIGWMIIEDTFIIW